MQPKKPIDRTKVEDALKRAAQAAVSGSREERSGRFLGGSRQNEAAKAKSDKRTLGRKT